MTTFAEAWEKYKTTEKFQSLQSELLNKGIKPPYCDNILWWAFSAGWLSKSKDEIERGRLDVLQMKSKLRHYK